MALFDDEHMGKPISRELKLYLQTYTTVDDRADVYLKTDVSVSLQKAVVERNRSLNEKNAPGIIELMRIAVKNCTNGIDRATKAKEYISKLLLENIE